MMLKNSEYEGLVEGLGTDGEGIIKAEGTTVFVPFCLIGERVKFKALKVNGGIAYGKLIEVIEKSAERRTPVCPVFGKCGGCDLQHASYFAQLEFKRASVENALKKIGGITAPVNGVVPCERQYGYRNKAALPIGVDADGNTVVGFYARRSHRIVAADNCAIQKDWIKNVFAAVKNYIKISGLKGYDETRGTGELRHFVVREINGAYIFALVVAGDADVQPLISELDKCFENYTLLLNINESKSNVIFGEKWKICRGKGFFGAEENGIKYKAGANTFLQVNDEMRTKLYAAALAEVDSDAVVIDAYSGGGMLTAMLAKKCRRAYGIEVVEEASHCADELKDENGLSGAMINICGKVEDRIGEVISKTQGEKRIVICDPPRKGMERSVIYAVLSAAPEKIILISCNPATLARDLGLLTGTLEEQNGALVKTPAAQGKYEIVSITPFDMFPQTKHVETLVVLTRRAQ